MRKEKQNHNFPISIFSERKEGDQVYKQNQQGQAKFYENFHKFVMKKFSKIAVVFFFVIGIFYSLSMLPLNYVCAVNNEQISPVQYSNLIFTQIKKFSNKNQVYFCQSVAQIQTFLLIGILIIFYLFSICFQVWLQQLAKIQSEKSSKIQNYGVLITGKNEFSQNNQEQIRQYLINFTKSCLKIKISSLAIDKDQQSLLNIQRYKQILEQNKLIQQLIFFPLRSNGAQVSFQKENSKYMIVLFSYQEITQTILEYWKTDKQMRNILNKEIVLISQAPQPNLLLYDKLVIQEQKPNNFIKNIFGFIVLEIIFIVSTAFIIFAIYLPNYIFSQFLVSNYKVLLRQILSLALSIIFFSFIQTIHNQFLINHILKRLSNTISSQRQLKIQVFLSFLFKITNLFILPFALFFAIEIIKQKFIIKTLYQILNQVMFESYGLSMIMLYYCIISWLIAPIFLRISQLFKSCFSTEANQQNQKSVTFKSKQFHRKRDDQKQQFVEISLAFLEIPIILAYSILINPIFILIVLIGIIIKYWKHFQTAFFIKIPFSFVSLMLKIIKYQILILSGLISNNCLLLYGILNNIVSIRLLIISSTFFGLIILSDLIISILSRNVKQNVKSSKKAGQFNLTKCIFKHVIRKLSFIFLDIQSQTFTYFFKQNYLQQSQQEDEIGNLNLSSFMSQTFIFKYQNQKSENEKQLLKFQNTDKSKVIQQLNTMSRTLEQTLKEKLFKNTINPFLITHHSEQPDMDFYYEDKVHMKPLKPKIKIPLLFKSQHANLYNLEKNQKPLFDLKNLSPIKIKLNSQNQHQKYPKIKQSKTEHEQNSNQQDSDIEYNIIQAQNNDKMSDINELSEIQDSQKDQKKISQLECRFIDLFGSEQESIKNKIRKAIKLSIPKIGY